MNSHKNARLTYARRVEMIQDLTNSGTGISDAAMAHGVTPPTVRKWPGRYLALGEAGLADASSRPTNSPRAIDPGKALAIVECATDDSSRPASPLPWGCPRAR
jgi:transposase-like protein